MQTITKRHRRFVEQYCAHFEGARAAREAGYAESRDKQTAYDLLQDPDIQQLIEERLEREAMSAAEATKRTADIARADIADFFTIEEDEEGNRYARLDLVKLVEEGPSHLVKKVKWTRHGPQIETYDAQQALKTLLDAHGAFNHKQQLQHDVRAQLGFTADERARAEEELDDWEPEDDE